MDKNLVNVRAYNIESGSVTLMQAGYFELTGLRLQSLLATHTRDSYAVESVYRTTKSNKVQTLVRNDKCFFFLLTEWTNYKLGW